MPASQSPTSASSAATVADSSDHGPEITACDSEPIHIPGAIQPHGLVLVADARTLRLVGGAGDIEGLLAPDWLGRSLGELLGDDVEAALAGGAGTRSLGQRLAGSLSFDVVAHGSGEWVIVELEPAPTTALSAVEVLTFMDTTSNVLSRAPDLHQLCERAAGVFRQLTGFDRVMIYRFLDDDAGVVVAEDRDPSLHTFMNHHFPASDIPRQARALYIRNRVRVIPDVTYEPAPLRPAGAGLAALDLSDVALRSVSPIHIQYLKNMGVAASASISIVKDGLLWGLVACHNQSPKRLPYATRMACSAVAGGLARQIKAKEDAENYRERLRLRAAEDSVVARLGGGSSLDSFLAGSGEELRRMLGADGFAAIQGRELYTSGRLPDDSNIHEVGAWVKARAVAAPYSTHVLGDSLASSMAYREQASGLLAATMSTEEPLILMWFRAEQIEVVNWAGNPHKAVKDDPGQTLTPRASFEAWSEQVRGRSKPWTLGEIEAVGRLRRVMFEARQNRRVRELNRELTATIADKETLLLQKDYLLKEVDHRVQNSLQLVSAFLGLQARAAGDGELSSHLAEAQSRLSAVALVHRRLYSDNQVETVDLARYLEDLCSEMTTSMGAEWRDEISLDLAPILISADRAVNLGLILTELVINANKYAYGGGRGPIQICLEQHRTRLRLIVGDHGAGKTEAREGFGTRMLNAMVERLSGTIEESSNEPGLRVIVTAPIGGRAAAD